MTRKFCSTAAVAAAILSALSTASWASTSTMVDSAGTAVVVDGRKASQRSDGVNSGGVNGGQILVIPQTVKEVARDLSDYMAGKESITATCYSLPSSSTVYTGPESQRVRVTNYAAGSTTRFGDREYLRNDGDYLQAKGRSSWNQTRLYKSVPGPDGLNDLPKTTVSSRTTAFKVTFNRTAGYSVEVESSGAKSNLGITSTGNLQSFAGKSYGFGSTGVSVLNHAILGVGTVTYTPAAPDYAAYKYLSSDTSYGGSASQLAVQTGRVGKFPPYYGALQHTAKIMDIKHRKDSSGNYTPYIDMTVETLNIHGNTFYAGYSIEAHPVAEVLNFSSSCSGYGCWYTGWKILNGYHINRNNVNPSAPATPFKRTLSCALQ